MSGSTYIGMKAWDMGFDAHLTIMYLGPMTEAEEFAVHEMIYPIKYTTFHVLRNKIEVFTPEIPVVTVTSLEGQLVNLRNYFEERGLVSPSTFPYNPHISLDLRYPGTIHIPQYIKLDQLNLY